MHGTTTVHLIKAIATTAAKIVIGIKVVLNMAALSSPDSSGPTPGNAKSTEDAMG